MQIKEVQEKLKISSYTLRYYEKMGLIQPYRDENGYRNYSEEDIHKIERIMFISIADFIYNFVSSTSC